MVTHKQGDIIIMDFNPQKGHEQSGRRPALVLSNDILNHHSSLAFVCPITNTNEKYPFLQLCKVKEIVEALFYACLAD